MGTYSYAVSRFVPDPIRNEAINIGVIVVDVETGKTDQRFMRNLRGLGRRCPGADLASLEKMVESIQVGDMPGGAGDLENLARKHTNLLQFTPPRAVAASTLEESLEHAFKTYIGEDVARERTDRSKGPKAHLLDEIDAALLSGGIAEAFKNRPHFVGRHGKFIPDRGVRGEEWTLALHAISFNAEAKASIAYALSAAKVLVVDFEDARTIDDDLECTVVAEPPLDDTRWGNDEYTQAAGHLKDRGCKVIRPSGMKLYAKEIGERLGLFDLGGNPLLRAREFMAVGPDP